ncbi:MAG TPA: nickel pincer cofactor biosynthesis protein LarC [Actinomycetota bacterium]|nr:nickel pincer cofactor biosynthesis protein LarC [Actinomycetota bacterium]
MWGRRRRPCTTSYVRSGTPLSKVEVERPNRHGIVATLVRVVEDGRLRDRRAGELLDLVASADLALTVRDRALDTLRRLAAAESRIHGVPEHDLVFHEVGGGDTVIDVVGAFALLEALAVDRVVCSPIPYARGRIETAHGSIPGPGPAVLAMLDGAHLFGVEAEAELVTPPGAAIAATAATSFGELPRLMLEGVGYGAGERDLRSLPNLLRVVLGISRTASPVAHIVVIEATLDDLLPELVPDAIEACRIAGALDVWTVPVQMKKGRPGVVLSAIARPDAERAVADALLLHSSTLGVRVTPMRRYEMERGSREVWVDEHPIRVKVGILDGSVVNVAPEHDDCVEVATATGRPVKQVWAAALAAAQTFTGGDDRVAQ